MFFNNCILTAVLLAIGVQSINLEGQPCYHVTKNLTGTCTLLINCDSAFQEVQKQVPPQVCGLADTAPIVCCPKIPVGYKSRQKCLEYSKLRKGECNIQFDRSVNFTNAVGKEFPHMVIVGYSKSMNSTGRTYDCGGTLISERFVLTTGECGTTRLNYQPKYVRLGDLNLKIDNDDAEPQEFKIEKVFLASDFSNGLAYNIALIKLNRDVEFTPYVSPTCLHVGRELDTSGRLLYAGWNTLRDDRDLRRVVLKASIDYNNCRVKYLEAPVGSNDDMFICTECKSPYLHVSSGGSLQTLRGDVDCMYDMVGILSLPYMCGWFSTPQAFVRISYYIEWIEEIVWP